jgi:hypothetical protein
MQSGLAVGGLVAQRLDRSTSVVSAGERFRVK